MRKKLTHTRGFTLIELAAVLIVVALLYSLVIPRFNDVTGLKLKSVTRKVAGLVKYTYDEAVSKNKKMRLVFNFDQGANKIWMEEWVEKSPLTPLSTKNYDESEDKMTLSQKEALEDEPSGEYQKFTDKLAKELKLPEYVKIKGIYIARENKVIESDSARSTASENEEASTQNASIVFLPSGFTEDSIIYISDKKERVYSIKVNPITGRPKVFDSYVRPENI